jgi:hypothetical protein
VQGRKITEQTLDVLGGPSLGKWDRETFLWRQYMNPNLKHDNDI